MSKLGYVYKWRENVDFLPDRKYIFVEEFVKLVEKVKPKHRYKFLQKYGYEDVYYDDNCIIFADDGYGNWTVYEDFGFLIID
jgi:hypothetical protein